MAREGLQEPLLHHNTSSQSIAGPSDESSRPALLQTQLTFEDDGRYFGPGDCLQGSQLYDQEAAQLLREQAQLLQDQAEAEAAGTCTAHEGHTAGHGHGHVHHHLHRQESTFAWTVLQMSKVILGSGMLVLPRAFQLLGCMLGMLLLCTVGVLTWFTVHGLVYAADKLGKRTYASTVRLSCGRPAKWGLLAAVFANCLGMCVVFLVIYGDILPIILREIWPSAANIPWLMDRRFILAAVLLLLLLPLSAQHDLQRLGLLALGGVGSVGLFAGASMLLAAAAVVQGTWQPLPWMPDWAGLAAGAAAGDGNSDGGSSGHGPALTGVVTIEAAAADASTATGTDSGSLATFLLMGAGGWVGGAPMLPGVLGTKHNAAASIVLGIAGVIPLLLNADICHQSIFPAMALLHPYSRRAFNSVMALALLLCNTLYTVIALCCLTVFGDQLDANVLNNMTAEGMAPLLGPGLAQFIALLVKLSYFVSLLGSFVFTLHPLRHCCLEIMLGSNFPTKKQAKADRLFLPLTLTLLALIYAIAVVVPGIWQVLSMVGSSASTFMGFVFPALVILVTERKPKWTHRLKKVCAVLVIAIGLFLFVNGFALQLLGPT